MNDVCAEIAEDPGAEGTDCRQRKIQHPDVRQEIASRSSALCHPYPHFQSDVDHCRLRGRRGSGPDARRSAMLDVSRRDRVASRVAAAQCVVPAPEIRPCELDQAVSAAVGRPGHGWLCRSRRPAGRSWPTAVRETDPDRGCRLIGAAISGAGPAREDGPTGTPHLECSRKTGDVVCRPPARERDREDAFSSSSTGTRPTKTNRRGRICVRDSPRCISPVGTS